MGKSKAKSTAGKTQIPEPKLLKALAELEDAVEKGDPLEDADTEGGLSTEGTPLSDAAPSGRSDTKKARRKSSSSSSAASSSVEKSDGDDDSVVEKADDDSSSDDASSGLQLKKKKKGAVAKAASMSSSSDSSSDDDDESDDSSDDDASSPAEKSFREVAEGDETMAKAIEVSDFIEAMVDQISLAMLQMAKSIRRIEGRLSARIDHRVAKSVAYQQSFNARLAKAVAAIGNSVQEDLVDMVKSMAGQPVAAPRGKAVLSKGEVNQPPWQGVSNDQRMANGSDGDFISELSELSPEAIGDWLFKKSANNQIDPKVILAWEADRYNIEALPPVVRKGLVNDLCK